MKINVKSLILIVVVAIFSSAATFLILSNITKDEPKSQTQTSDTIVTDTVGTTLEAQSTTYSQTSLQMQEASKNYGYEDDSTTVAPSVALTTTLPTVSATVPGVPNETDEKINDKVFASLYKNGLFELEKSYEDIPEEIFEELDLNSGYVYVNYGDLPEAVKLIIAKTLGKEGVEYSDDALLMGKKEGNLLFYVFAGHADEENFVSKTDLLAHIIIDTSTGMYYLDRLNNLSEDGKEVLRGHINNTKEKLLSDINAEFVGIAYDTIIFDEDLEAEICMTRLFIDFDSDVTSVFETFSYYDDNGVFRGAARDPLETENQGYMVGYDDKFNSSNNVFFDQICDLWIDVLEDRYGVWLYY